MNYSGLLIRNKSLRSGRCIIIDSCLVKDVFQIQPKINPQFTLMLPFGGQNTTLSTHLNIGFEDRRRRGSKSSRGERNMQDD